MRRVILNGLFGSFMGLIAARYIFPTSVSLGIVLLLVFLATIINSMIK